MAVAHTLRNLLLILFAGHDTTGEMQQNVRLNETLGMLERSHHDLVDLRARPPSGHTAQGAGLTGSTATRCWRDML